MSDLEREIEELFDSVGAGAALHAQSVDRTVEFGLSSDEPVVTASVFKIAVLLEVTVRAARGELLLTERVRVPADRRTLGPTGLSVMVDDADLSLRDLAFWMMCVSDNTATDVLIERLGGVEAINRTLRALGRSATVLEGDCHALLASLIEEVGEDFGTATPEALAKCTALIPGSTNRTTPRDITALLSLIWTDDAGPPEACAEIRRIMALQVWPHRLTSGFADGCTLAAKTGTLPGIRNEAGVVTYPDGRQYAVGVFTKARAMTARQPAIDAAIGRAARLAVDHLRLLQGI